MKKPLKFILATFLLINLLIVLSGKLWIYKGVSITYLKGHTSSYIDDFIYFSANIINTGPAQEWAISKNYNNIALPEFINPINNQLETVAFIVIKKDSIQYEKYWHGYSSSTISNSFSMSKSWVSTLIGIAIKNGDIKHVNQSICDFLPEFCLNSNSNITIKHLLTMSSGLNWKENYYNPLGQAAEAYYGTNLKQKIRY